MTAPVTVADLLADPLLRGARTLAGHAGLERLVTDVTVYRGGAPAEVTGHLVVCDAEQTAPAYRLDALVRRAQEAGAAALCVTSADARPLLSTIRLADRLEIPVLWLVTEDPFTLVVELTLRIRAHEVLRARTVETLVKQLSARTDGAELLAVACRVLDARISLVTAEGSAILGDTVPLREVRTEIAVPQRTDRLLAHPVHTGPAAPREGSGPTAAAWLVWAFERADQNRAGTVALGLAVLEPFVRSWLAGERTRADHDAVLRERLLDEVTTGRASVSRDAVERALSLGWRLEDWHVGFHLRCDNQNAFDRPGVVPEQVSAALARYGVPVQVVAERDGGWAAWTSSTREPAPDEARRLLRVLRLVLAGLPEQWRPVAGIGWPHQGPGGLADTLAEARNAAHLARAREFRPAVEHTDELGVSRLLAAWQQSDITRAFAETALAPLRGAEHAHLLTTLRVFLENGGSSAATARVLGLHRNTVATRLRQARDRLGVDLDDPSRRLALQMACRTLDPQP
ncbi:MULTISPECIES: helix-turn-helix domain-containing protein [unclassified Streptomyces]|uniref:helix-turn-helix domain-containing protein n=1 Tax=unclassified Streptomyces TaxID=2593676 RepID=UPI0036E77403